MQQDNHSSCFCNEEHFGDWLFSSPTCFIFSASKDGTRFMRVLQLCLSWLLLSQLARWCSPAPAAAPFCPARQQHRHPPPPAAPCPAAAHPATSAQSPAWEQSQSNTPALLHSLTAPRCGPQSQGLRSEVLRSGSPSRPERSSTMTAVPLVCAHP